MVEAFGRQISSLQLGYFWWFLKHHHARTELEDILQIGASVHDTLKGMKVLHKLETI